LGNFKNTLKLTYHTLHIYIKIRISKKNIKKRFQFDNDECAKKQWRMNILKICQLHAETPLIEYRKSGIIIN